MWRRVALLTVLLALVSAGGVRAQDQTTNPEELNRKYQEALTQLKAAQDRKNELATENEQLAGRIKVLEKQLEDAKREAVAVADRTYELRSQYSAWEAFLKRYPTLLREWKLFVARNPLAVPNGMPVLADPEIPLSAE